MNMSEELQTKTPEELLQLKLELETDIDSIKAQIDAAQAKARETGVFADSVWWGKAKWALKVKGRKCQEIQLLLRQKNRAQQASLETTFVTMAREILPEEQFRQIMNQTRARIGA